MSLKIKQFEFGDFVLDAEERVLRRNGQPVSMTPKALQLLQILVENHGRVVERNDLLQMVWADSFVEEGNLTFTIGLVRKALGDVKQSPRFIETVPRRGYRFIADVTEIREQVASEGRSPEPDLPKPVTVATMSPKRKILVLAATVAVVCALVAVWLVQRSNSAPAAPILSTPFASEMLSTSGNVLRAVISPDGKNVVYTSGVEGRQSVWIRQLDNGNNVEIIPPSDDVYYGLEVSSDGNTLYFVRAPKSVSRQFEIYRVPIFGGIPVKIIDRAEGWISISPDNQRISFVRCRGAKDEFCTLLIADAADGQNERKIASRPSPLRIADNQFSPDGKSVAFAVGQSETQSNEFGLASVSLETGAERELTGEKFFNVRSVTHLPDNRGMLISASRVPNKRYAIWNLNLATGEVVPVTKDSEVYSEISIDGGARQIVATTITQNFKLYLTTFDNPSARKLLGDASGVSFSSDGKVILSSLMTGNDEIWSVSKDGSQRRQLTNNSADEVAAVGSPDGKWIYFSSNRTGGIHVWRMQADGSNQSRITTQTGGFPLFVTPDGQWIYFHHGLDKTLWRVSSNGGSETLVIDKGRHQFAFSPDGTRVAFAENVDGLRVLAIVSLADSRTVTTVKIPDQKAELLQLKWSSDGLSLLTILADNESSAKTLWIQSADGGAPRRIADLGNELIAGSGFAVAPDGSGFALVQGGWQHDAVLLKGLK